MNPSTKQLVRMLAMVPYLQSNQGIPLVDLAREFNIKPSVAQRELEIMMLTGRGEFHGDLIDFDLSALERDGVVHIRDAEFMPRPLRVSRREAAALIVALRTLRQAAGGDQAEVIDTALAKLAEAAGTEDEASIDVRLPAVDAAVNDAVGRALTQRRQLQMVYATESRDAQQERTVDPHRVFTQDGHRYLSAWCHRAGADRLFRVDRIVAATVLPTRIETDDNPPALPDGLFEPSPDTPSAVVDVSADARWLVGQYRMEILNDHPDGSVRARIHGTDQAWLRRVVLRSGGRLVVVEPRELADQIQADAAVALAAYDQTETV